ncbi:MAG: FixH family protein [Alphaproteobacteria bacterium]|jgi:nitrogen fixation protein FixH|nr:FixH family protein [Alphaproteobacteria bacterium]
MSEIAMTENKEPKLKGRHVLYWMIGFFAVMLTANGIFLYHAITSFPGEDVKKSYLQGLNYNQTLEARAAQAALGWRAELGLQDDEIVLRLEDKYAQPLSARPVVGELRRRASQMDDRTLIFAPNVNGTYIAPVEPLEKGQWELRVQVLDPTSDETVFTAYKTLIVK